MKKILLKISILASLFVMLSGTGHAQCTNVYDTTRASVCRGDTFYFYGVGHTRTNTYRDSVAIAGGCDSIHVLLLTRVNIPNVTINQNICTGSSYVFNGQTLTTSGTYRDTLHFASVFGCDSITTLNLTVGGYISSNINASMCRGSSYIFYGQTLTVAGTYRDTTANGGGCDTIYVLRLTYLPNGVNTTLASICPGGSYVYHGNTYTTPGNYGDTIHGAAANGCDSVNLLRLTYYRLGTSTTTATICTGSSYNWNGQVLTASGIYSDTLHGAGANGCDSLDVLRLTVGTLRGPTVRDTICFGSSIQIGNQTVTTTGRYNDTIVTTGGCDSVVQHRVVVDSLPLPAITPSGNLLTGTTGTGWSYQWLESNNPISSATASTYTAPGAGSYTYMITDGRGCSRTSAAYVITGLITIGEDAARVRIYPNPNAGSFVLETTNAIGYDAVIYDILGKVVENKTISKDKMNMQINNADGVYLLLIKDGKNTISSARFTVSH